MDPSAFLHPASLGSAQPRALRPALSMANLDCDEGEEERRLSAADARHHHPASIHFCLGVQRPSPPQARSHGCQANLQLELYTICHGCCRPFVDTAPVCSINAKPSEHTLDTYAALPAFVEQ